VSVVAAKAVYSDSQHVLVRLLCAEYGRHRHPRWALRKSPIEISIPVAWQ